MPSSVSCFTEILSTNWLFAVIIKLEVICLHVESVYCIQNHIQFSVTVFLCLLTRWSWFLSWQHLLKGFWITTSSAQKSSEAWLKHYWKSEFFIFFFVSDYKCSVINRQNTCTVKMNIPILVHVMKHAKQLLIAFSHWVRVSAVNFCRTLFSLYCNQSIGM